MVEGSNPPISMSVEMLAREHSVLVNLTAENIELRQRLNLAQQYIDQQNKVIEELRALSPEAAEIGTEAEARQEIPTPLLPQEEVPER